MIRKVYLGSPVNKLTFFSLGVFVATYLLIQYLVTPMLMWFFDTNLVYLLSTYHADVLMKAIHFSCLALFFFLAGWLLCKKKIQQQAVLIDWNCDRVIKIAFLLYGSIIVYRLAKYFLGAYAFPDWYYNNLIGPIWFGILIFPSKIQLYLALASLIAYLAAKQRLQPITRLMAMALVLFLVISGLFTRSRTAIFAPLLCIGITVMLMANNTTKRRVGFSMLLLIPVAIIMKAYTRRVDVSLGGNILLLGVADIVGRVSMSANLISVMTYFQEKVHGLSIPVMYLLSLPSSVVPHFLHEWASSADPFIKGGNEFGRAFGLASENDHNTGIAIPLLADSFMNFGTYGTYLFMFMYGLVLRAIHNHAISYPSCSNLFILVITYSIAITGQEDQIGVLLAKLTIFALFYVLFSSLISRQWPSAVSLPQSQQGNSSPCSRERRSIANITRKSYN